MYDTKPRKIATAEALQALIDNYFRDCDSEGRPYSVNNMALACGVSCRVLIGYEQIPEYQEIIGIAKTKICGYLETIGFEQGKSSQAQFLLKGIQRDIWGDQSKVNLGGQEDSPVKIDGLSLLLTQLHDQKNQ